MEEEIKKTFREHIEDLYKLHYVTKRYDHYITKRLEGRIESLKLFEATKFVYAYFAFNSFYNYDWEASIKENELIGYKKNTIVKNGKEVEEELSDGSKFKKMSDFIFTRIEESDKDVFFRLIIQAGTKHPKYEKIIQSILENINSITVDNRITEEKKNSFLKRFRKLLEKRTIKNDEFKEILHFVYMVRNNIFHGTKNTIEMSEERQRERLEIYANILIATNEMLFKILQKGNIFLPQTSYHIDI